MSINPTMPSSVTAAVKEAGLVADGTTPKEPRASAPFDAGNDNADDALSDYDDDGDEDEYETNFQDAAQELDYAPSESAAIPASGNDANFAIVARCKLDKKALKAATAEAERTLNQDIADVQTALDMFLNSRFVESENFLIEKYGESLFHTLGFAVVSWLKAVMTFDPKDIETASEGLRTALEIANIYRKETGLLGSFAGMIMRNKEGSALKSMTPLQRHAELAYAEGHLLKSMLSLVTDTNIMAFVREGINIRSSYNIYKTCYRFLQRTYDEEGGAHGLVKNNVDEHFVSGVLLGVGSFNVVLSMLPAKVLRLFELIGFSGDRDFGLSRLEIGGMWDVRDRSALAAASVKSSKKKKQEKAVSRTDSLAADAAFNMTAVPFAMPVSHDGSTGLRKSLCDITLLGYHVVLSSAVQLPDCDIPFAKHILESSIKKYPNGLMYLALRARLHQTEGDPASAIREYDRVIAIQNEWRQLVHVCIWDSGTCQAALGNWTAARDNYDIMFKESKWSKAIYRYLQAVYHYAADPVAHQDEVSAMLKEVPKLTRKVAGKSIPLEKFVARKCRKWELQKNRLLLPHLEMLYILNGFDVIPASDIPHFIATVDAELKLLEAQIPDGDNPPPYKTFYDDLCLTRLLKGILTRDTAIPNSSTLAPVVELAQQPPPTAQQQQTLQYAARQLEYVRHQADKIALDHWLLPFSRMELGKLYVRAQEYEKARKEFEAALRNGYGEEDVGSPPQGKISLENTLHFRVHNAMVKLDVLERIVESR
ncbi:hypothetical protein DFJ77DRAFT_450115 [Powellomyces hirtus]|nr:hypothetical protein DFJ77DRAFT_450115 [Powellomyces hirtus]